LSREGLFDFSAKMSKCVGAALQPAPPGAARAHWRAIDFRIAWLAFGVAGPPLHVLLCKSFREHDANDQRLTSSRSTTPSLILTMRWAYSAMSCSWVTRTMVLPSECRRSKRAMISLPVWESRFPVG